MKDFFTLKNITTIAGVVASFVLPHIFFNEDEYEIIEPVEDLEPKDDDVIVEKTITKTEVKEPTDDQQED